MYCFTHRITNFLVMRPFSEDQTVFVPTPRKCSHIIDFKALFSIAADRKLPGAGVADATELTRCAYTGGYRPTAGE
jgi:hypothetical protein